MNAHLQPQPVNKLHTVKEAARAVGIPYWKILRAVNAGIIPSYRLLNSRRYVKLADIEQAMTEGQNGGRHD